MIVIFEKKTGYSDVVGQRSNRYNGTLCINVTEG